MDVHDDVQAVLERPGDEEISFGINVVGQSEVRRGVGVMMPGDGQAHMVEAFGFDMHEICFRIFRAPVLSGRRFQIIAQVRAAEKFLRRSMRRGAAAGEPAHFVIIRRQNGARLRKNSHGHFGCNIQPQAQRFIVPNASGPLL